MTNREIIERSYSDYYKHFIQKAYAKAARVGLDYNDLLQETFARLVDTYGDEKKHLEEDIYVLVQIFMNRAAIEIGRKKYGRNDHKKDTEVLVDNNDIGEIAASRFSPDDVPETLVSRENLHIVLKTLANDPKRREVEALTRRANGMTAAETAEAMGVKTAVVDTYVSLARKRLVTNLGPEKVESFFER